MKRRIITMAVSFLLCIGMVGAGFAAWIITGNTTETQTGSIEVQEVVDNRLDLTIAWAETGVTGADDDAKIIFGKHATDTCSWLANDDVDEKLTAKLSITVNNHAELIAADLTYSFAFNLVATGDSETAGYGKAVDAGLVGALPTITDVTANETGAYEITITFAWGTAFGGVNPLTKYKDTTYNKATADTVKDQLEKLYTYLSGVGYTLTITGSVTANS